VITTYLSRSFDGLREVQGLVLVQRVGAAVADVAKGAAAGALVAHDHERRRAVAEALADVGAGGFLADRVQVAFAQDLLDLVEAGRGRAGLDADPVGLLERFALLDNLDGNARELGRGLLLGQRVVVLGRLGLPHDGRDNFECAHWLLCDGIQGAR
jgi:hypothetical protein